MEKLVIIFKKIIARRLSGWLLAFCAVGILFPACAQAAVTTFDWNQSYGTWTAGSPAIGGTASQSYNNDSAHLGTGNDVTISITNNGGNWGTGGTGNPGSPSVNTNYNGGFTTKKTLDLNYATETVNTPDLTVKIDFSLYSAGVANVAFSIYDVDYSPGTWIDQISGITAVTMSGSIIGATSITTSSYNTLTGSGTGSIVTGRTGNAGGSSNLGNVGISFGTNVVKSVTFSWANTDAAKGDQKISLSNITYTDASPEVHPGLAAMAACVLVVAVRRSRTRRV
jgi:hypothetical protein